MGKEERIIAKLTAKPFVSGGEELIIPNLSGDHSKGGNIPVTKLTYNGSDCSGSSGDADRTLTASKVLIPSNTVILDRAVLIENTDYTRSGKVITFTVVVFNDAKIQIIT